MDDSGKNLMAIGTTCHIGKEVDWKGGYWFYMWPSVECHVLVPPNAEAFQSPLTSGRGKKNDLCFLVPPNPMLSSCTFLNDEETDVPASAPPQASECHFKESDTPWYIWDNQSHLLCLFHLKVKGAGFYEAFFCHHSLWLAVLQPDFFPFFPLPTAPDHVTLDRKVHRSQPWPLLPLSHFLCFHTWEEFLSYPPSVFFPSESWLGALSSQRWPCKDT